MDIANYPYLEIIDWEGHKSLFIRSDRQAKKVIDLDLCYDLEKIIMLEATRCNKKRVIESPSNKSEGWQDRNDKPTQKTM